MGEFGLERGTLPARVCDGVLSIIIFLDGSFGNGCWIGHLSIYIYFFGAFKPFWIFLKRRPHGRLVFLEIPRSFLSEPIL